MRRDTARDLIGGPVFWAAALATLAALMAALVFKNERTWIGLGALLMWTSFSLANAIRSRRLHSIVSAPVYFAAAAAVAASAIGRIDVQIWMIWLIGAGIIAANVSERIFGRYL